MGDALLTWVFDLNPTLLWFCGGLVCMAAYLVGVPDSDDPRENRDRAMVSDPLIVIWPSVLIWLGPVCLAVRVTGKWGGWLGTLAHLGFGAPSSSDGRR